MSEQDLLNLNQQELRRILLMERDERDTIKERLWKQHFWLKVNTIIGICLLTAIVFNSIYTSTAIRETLKNRTYADTLKAQINEARTATDSVRNELHEGIYWSQKLYQRGDTLNFKFDSLFSHH